MSTPRADLVTIATTPALILELLDDLFVKPRRSVHKWSRITQQTAQVRLAYPGQHLASLITGVPGEGTAARGNDLRDGTEVKSCSRADQLGSCRKCQNPVLPYMTECPACSSSSISRKTDSHWILSIRSDAELRQYTDAERVLFILFDRPADDETAIRVRSWEVWPQVARHAYFTLFVTDYYENNYRAKTDAGLKAAPCNLHPLKRDFLLMNPLLTFEALIQDADDEERATAQIRFWHQPLLSRERLLPEYMPASQASSSDRESLVNALPDVRLAELSAGAMTPADVASLRRSGRRARIAADLQFLDEDARLSVPFKEKRIKETNTEALRRAIASRAPAPDLSSHRG